MSSSRNSSSDPTPPPTPEEREEKVPVEEQEMEPPVEEQEEQAENTQQEFEEEAFAEATTEEVATEELPPEEAEDIPQENASFGAGAGCSRPIPQQLWSSLTNAEWHRYQAYHGVQARLFVGNFPNDMNNSEFQYALQDFRAFGPSHGQWRFDPINRMITAFIQYENPRHAANALAVFHINPGMFVCRDRILRVEQARGGRRGQLTGHPGVHTTARPPQRYYYPAPPDPWGYHGQPMSQPPQYMLNFASYQWNMAPYQYQPTYGNWGHGNYPVQSYPTAEHQGHGYGHFNPAYPNYGYESNEAHPAPAYDIMGYQGNNGYMPAYPAPDPTDGNGEYHQPQDPNAEQQ